MPPGLLPGSLVQMPQEGGACGSPGIPAVYIGRGEAVFEFRLPEKWRGQVEELVVVVGSDGSWASAPDTAIYNWRLGKWAALEDPIIGRNVIDGDHADGLVSEDGVARVRLSSSGNQGGCFYVDLGFEGTRSLEGG